MYDFFLQWIGEWPPPFLPLVLSDQDPLLPHPSLPCPHSVSHPTHRVTWPPMLLLSSAARWGDGRKEESSWLARKWSSGTFSCLVCPFPGRAGQRL